MRSRYTDSSPTVTLYGIVRYVVSTQMTIQEPSPFEAHQSRRERSLQRTRYVKTARPTG